MEHSHAWLLDDHTPESGATCMDCGERKEFKPVRSAYNRAWANKKEAASMAETVLILRRAEMELTAYAG